MNKTKLKTPALTTLAAIAAITLPSVSSTIGLYARFVAPTRVPEPGTLSLLALGLLAVGGATRRKSR
jgi:hypothetical protein